MATAVAVEVQALLAERSVAADRSSRARERKPVTSSRERTRPANPTGKTSSRPTAVRAPDGSRAEKVIAFGLAQVGKPYKWAAAGPGAYDCSGLAMAAYATVGITLPHQTGGILARGRAVARAQMRPGDLVFTSDHHVGIYLGGGKMVHAPHPGDHVRVADVYAFYAARRLL